MAKTPKNGVQQAILSLLEVERLRAASDEELVQRFAQSRNEAAFRVIAERHGPMVLGVCVRALGCPHDAEDAFQATFLIFSQRAGSIRKSASLASWLHGVARRVANELERSNRRRNHREQSASTPTLISPVDELSWAEVKTCLDEELERLPVAYRNALVVCYLEGHTRDEAAKRLGVDVGVVKGRLERGRKMLAERLTKRGVTFSAGLLTVALSPGTVSAIVRAGSLFTAGESITPLVTPGVLLLTNNVLKGMVMTKLKLIAASLLCSLVLVIGVGYGIAQTPAIQQEVDSKLAALRLEALQNIQADTDVAFIRRVSRDLRGIEPSPAEVHFFVTSRDAKRRGMLVDLFIKERLDKAPKIRTYSSEAKAVGNLADELPVDILKAIIQKKLHARCLTGMEKLPLTMGSCVSCHKGVFPDNREGAKPQGFGEDTQGRWGIIGSGGFGGPSGGGLAGIGTSPGTDAIAYLKAEHAKAVAELKDAQANLVRLKDNPSTTTLQQLQAAEKALDTAQRIKQVIEAGLKGSKRPIESEEGRVTPQGGLFSVYPKQRVTPESGKSASSTAAELTGLWEIDLPSDVAAKVPAANRPRLVFHNDQHAMFEGDKLLKIWNRYLLEANQSPVRIILQGQSPLWGIVEIKNGTLRMNLTDADDTLPKAFDASQPVYKHVSKTVPQNLMKFLDARKAVEDARQKLDALEKVSPRTEEITRRIERAQDDLNRALDQIKALNAPSPDAKPAPNQQSGSGFGKASPEDLSKIVKLLEARKAVKDASQKLDALEKVTPRTEEITHRIKLAQFELALALKQEAALKSSSEPIPAAPQ